MVTLADCVDEQTADYECWYRDVFVPQVDAVPVVTGLGRYCTAFPSEQTFRSHPRYLTIVELEHDDIAEAGRRLRTVYDAIRPELGGREIRRLDTLYTRVGAESRSPRSHRQVAHVYCGLVACTDTRREDEWNKWYDEKHLDDALSDPFDTAYRFRVVDPSDPVPHQASPYLSLYETGYNLAELQERLAAFRARLVATDTLFVSLLTIQYSGLFRPLI